MHERDAGRPAHPARHAPVDRDVDALAVREHGVRGERLVPAGAVTDTSVPSRSVRNSAWPANPGSAATSRPWKFAPEKPIWS
ncbi:hypothetical protein BJF90_36545 [Pseudonocardia sp. CNS-004]|nr:hypothetical protein BJF90_36545 [Pseudonocardia sp. CNS-004]